MENPLFDKILFPTDLSMYAIKSLDCITELPGVREVILLHVIDATTHSKRGWTHEPEIENARLTLERYRKDLEALGLSVRMQVDVITSGSVPDRILETAKTEEVSLIVMGARGRGVVKGILLGSVSGAVLHRTPTHVMVMRHKIVKGEQLEKFCQRIFSHVLVPIDFTEEASAGLEMIARLPQVGKISVLHAVSQGETHEEVLAKERQAEAKLEELSHKDVCKDVNLVTAVRIGSPIEEIIRFSEEADISLICMTSHGKGLFRELLIGSTSHDVVRHARCPVLVLQMKTRNNRSEVRSIPLHR